MFLIGSVAWGICTHTQTHTHILYTLIHAHELELVRHVIMLDALVPVRDAFVRVCSRVQACTHSTQSGARIMRIRSHVRAATDAVAAAAGSCRTRDRDTTASPQKPLNQRLMQLQLYIERICVRLFMFCRSKTVLLLLALLLVLPRHQCLCDQRTMYLLSPDTPSTHTRLN